MCPSVSQCVVCHGVYGIASNLERKDAAEKNGDAVPAFVPFAAMDEISQTQGATQCGLLF